jgi:exodeoxyribonuclease VII large subunit
VDLFAKRRDRIFTVSELAGGVRDALEKSFGFIRVVGEISGLTVAGSGHAYFTLKDDKATLSTVMFKTALGRLGGNLPADGTQVEGVGRLTFYEPRGRTQLVLEWLVPCGEGEFGLRFLRLKSKLQAEGLFDPSKKRPLPTLPASIGLVTSQDGAAVRDVLKVLSRRFPSVPVLVCPVRVQGEGAALEIAQGIERMGDGNHGQVLIVTRGGGSIEDLWAFNEEVLVRSIAAAKVPVISAVGHETDLVLSDLAADVRAPTPSAAAELVVPDREQLHEQLNERAKTLAQVMRLSLSASRYRLLDLSGRFRDPRLILAGQRLRMDDLSRRMHVLLGEAINKRSKGLDEFRIRLATFEPHSCLKRNRQRNQQLSTRLFTAMRVGTDQARQQVLAFESALLGLSPLAVLSRGYALASDSSGNLLREAGEVKAKDSIFIRLHRGSLTATVETIRHENKGIDKK